MISYFLILLAAFFNAVMDALENENFNESIFSHLNQKFWYKRESWKYAKMIGGYRLDAWHICKSLMVTCLIMAIYCAQFSDPIWHTQNGWFNILLDVLVGGIVWNVAFVLFYHKLFKVK